MFRARCGAIVLIPLVCLASSCATSRATQSGTIQSPDHARQWESQLDLDNPLVGVIWDITARRSLGEGELVARVQSAAIVAVGEMHDNPDHHRIEATIVAAFATRHESPAVVFEMLDRREQATIDASLQAHPGDVDALAEAVHWASSGWPPWSMYRPVFAAAVASDGVVLAGGIDHGEAMRIAHEGPASFDPALDRAFGLESPLAAEEQVAMKSEMAASHCGLLPDEMLDSMVLVQRTRDALLAERLQRGMARGHGAVLIAGNGHVRKDRGVPAQLRRVGISPSLAIGLLEVSAGVTNPEAYAAELGAAALPFDYVWFTPRVSDVDHCAKLRERLKPRPTSPGA